MAVLVIDASVAVKWFVRESGTESALRLLEGDALLIAPEIFRPEAVNALLKQHRRGQLGDDLLDRALSGLELNMPQLVASGSLMERATSIARRLRHPIYDCLYLALAERWSTAFVTADARFVRTCRAGLVDDSIVERLRILEEYQGQ